MNSQRETNTSPSFAPRTSQWLLWMSVKTILGLVRFTRLVTGRQRSSANGSKLVIESGERGWGLIEYEGIYDSACDYLGNERVSKNVVTDRR